MSSKGPDMEFISHWLSLFNSCLIQRTRHGIHLTLAQFVQQLSHPKDQAWNSSHTGSVCSTAVSSKGPDMEFISHWLSLFNSCLIQRTRHGIHLTLAQFVQQLSHPKDQAWNSSHTGSVCSTAVSSKGPGMEFISHWLSLFNNCLIQRTRLNSSPVYFLSSRRPGF